MDILVRFLKHVDSSRGTDECHLWTGCARNKAGYGSFRVAGKNEVAHRWLLGHLRGTPLVWPREIGCHTCDNKRCVNPAHLYIGSHSENTHDAIARAVIRDEVAEFLKSDRTELWAYYSAYDHVVLSQLFGRMLDLPKHVPMRTKDVADLIDTAGMWGICHPSSAPHTTR